MRVAMVTSELHPWKTGGPQNVAYHLANRLAEKLELSMLCIAPSKGSSPYEHYREEITFHLVEDRGPTCCRYAERNLAYLREAGSLQMCDVVHFHIMPGANCFFLPSRLRSKSRARLVLTFYDWVPYELRFYAAGERLRHVLHWLAARPRLGLFDRYVVNSAYMKGIVLSHGYRPVEVIPNGIDAGEWALKEKAALGEGVSAFFWGRLYEKKGVGQLIRAAALLGEGGGGFHLYIGGEGPEGERYRDMCRSLGLQGKITFLGPLTDTELKRYLAACDFCVLPSAYEGFGISILEAMAAGKAVITSRRGGQTDFARDRHNAILVEPEDADGLAGAMREMIRDKQLRTRLGTAAAATAATFTWDWIADSYLDLYRRLLGRA